MSYTPEHKQLSHLVRVWYCEYTLGPDHVPHSDSTVSTGTGQDGSYNPIPGEPQYSITVAVLPTTPSSHLQLGNMRKTAE